MVNRGPVRFECVAVLVCVLAVFAAGCATSPGASGAKAGLRAGAASAPITPPEGTFLAGYELNRRSTGVHDDLYAKAVVFDDGQTPLAIVVVDCIGLQYPAVTAIRALAASKTAAIHLSAERIVVASTHTHCGPDVIGIWGPDDTHTGYDAAYMTKLVQTAAEQVARAAANLVPARLAYAETDCSGWAVNDSEPGVVDNSVAVLQCLGRTGRTIATLTNFACHPTVLDGDTTQVSADWVGSFYKAMSDALPGEHLFLQGPIGAWIQPETPERTHALAEKYGRDLGLKTIQALRRPKPLADTRIRFANKVFQMPVENPAFRQMSALKLIPRLLKDTAETEVAWFAIGAAQFATHPGETAPEYGKQTKELMHTSGPKFVIGLGLDELGYIIRPDYFGGTGIPFADYLTSMSPGKEAGVTMMRELGGIIP